MIPNIYCHYCNTWDKTKDINNIKMKNNELKEVCIKNRTSYYDDKIYSYNDKIRIDFFDFNSTLLDEKSHENL